MNRLCIADGRLITPSGVIEHAGVVAEGGRIVEAGAGVKPGGGKVIDACGRYISPGFIDLHVHGGGGHDFMDGTVGAILGAAHAHALHGTTTMLPTTLACEDAELFGFFSAFRRAKSMRSSGANLPGLHLEGPYFALSQCGAQDPDYILNPNPEHYLKILEAGGGNILRWSAAPELPGAQEFGEILKSRGILVSVAHTDAFFEQVEVAMEFGFTHMTHLYSSMQGVRRVGGFRRAGAVEAAYVLDGLTVEVIADGVHLPGPLLRQVYRNIGPGRAALVTDAMRAAGTDCSSSVLGSLKNGVPVAVEGGVAWLSDRSSFAGSVATMDCCVRTMVREGGAGLPDAVRMATATPAAIMGFKTKGAVAPGMDADLVLFDDDVNVSCVVIGGKALS